MQESRDKYTKICRSTQNRENTKVGTCYGGNKFLLRLRYFICVYNYK